MKTGKKLGVIFCTLLICLGFVFLGKKASAIQSTDFSTPPATYTILSQTQISAAFGDKSTVNFNLGNPLASPLVFTPATTQFPNFMFCSGTNITMPSQFSTTATINAKWIVNPLAGQNCNTVALRVFTFTGTINLTNPAAAGGAATTTNSCEASFNFGFEWLFCPILRGIDDFVSKVNNFVDGQLNFNVRQNLQDPPGIKQVWSIFRIIASAVLVILMLVMVLSQAVSIGPFDAYTVRKLLPRLIAAVILIQLSWSIAIYAIEFANDLGRGIVGLLTVPFGGKDQLGLDQLIGKLGQATPGVFVAGSLFAIVAAVLINPFGAIMLAFVALVAVIAALGTLLVRDALIVASVIFLPMAFLAWILPGTQKYWKLLWDNFVKALLLFPIIAGLIYVGRIFAWIVANSSGTPGILDLFAIVIGFFGPYFLLPKAFRWGGSIMSSAANGINNGVNKVSERPKSFIKGRQEELKHFRQTQSAQRVYRGNPSLWRGDQFRSGKWDPSFLVGGGGKERRNAQIARYVEKGKKGQGEEVAAFSSLIGAEIENMNRRDALNHLSERFEETEGAERWAVMQKVAQLQDGAGLTSMRDQLAAEGQVAFWNNFVNGNYDQLKGISPHLANGIPQAATIDVGGVPRQVDFTNPNQRQTYFSGLDSGRFTGMKDEELAVMSDDGWQHFATVNADQARLRARRIGSNETQRGRMAPTALGLAGITGGTATATARTESSRIIEQTLPDPATLTVGNPAREAFKVQLRTDESARRAVARGFAYNVADPVFAQVLSEVRNDAVTAGTPEARRDYNSIVDEIQRAYQQRINETAAAVGGRGRNPVDARTAASNRIAPEIANLEPTAPPPPLGTPDLRKLL